MTAFMMYMSGNSLQMFSIMMVVMAFKNPAMGLVNTNAVFERFEKRTERKQNDQGEDGIEQRLLAIKLVYVAMQILALAVGVWKVNAMGLLP